jgi:hypothetical protein
MMAARYRHRWMSGGGRAEPLAAWHDDVDGSGRDGFQINGALIDSIERMVCNHALRFVLVDMAKTHSGSMSKKWTVIGTHRTVPGSQSIAMQGSSGRSTSDNPQVCKDPYSGEKGRMRDSR